MSEQEIHNICKKYDITNYTINSDESIDVNGSVNLSYRKLTKIPLKFNKVSGNFWIDTNNNLTSLERSPKEVGGNFHCYNNNLTSLKGYNGNYDKLYCDNKNGLILKWERKQKLKLLDNL